MSLSRTGGSLSRMMGLCPGEEVSVQGGGMCQGRGSLSRERVSVQRGLCPGRGFSVRETPLYSYGRAVCILLECILVWLMFLLRHIFIRKDIRKNIYMKVKMTKKIVSAKRYRNSVAFRLI